MAVEGVEGVFGVLVFARAFDFAEELEAVSPLCSKLLAGCP